MMDVKITTLKMPIEQIQNAILTVREAHDRLIVLEGERAALGAVEAVRERAGEEGVRRRQIALEALDERWAGIVSDAQAAVDAQARAAVEAIDAQVTPNGADIIGANEGDFALIPSGISFALCACSQSGIACAIGIDDGNLLLTLVGLDTIVTNLIDNLATVGTGLGSTNTSHGPEGLGGHQVTCQLDVLLSDFHVVLGFCAARSQKENEGCHCK